MSTRYDSRYGKMQPLEVVRSLIEGISILDDFYRNNIGLMKELGDVKRELDQAREDISGLRQEKHLLELRLDRERKEHADLSNLFEEYKKGILEIEDDCKELGIE